MKDLLDRAKAIAQQLQSWRRHFHQHPELGFQEVETARYIAKALAEMGYRVQEGVGRTGVVAEMGTGEPVVGLRADMDALPIQEENEVAYASHVPGVMHACGHDGHMAMLLGAARLLAAKPPARGRVRLLFQPSEEAVDDEAKSGAMRMIEDGAMEGVEAIFGLHVDADLPLGTLRTRAGPFMAATDPFFGFIRGVSGHGARPHQAVDPIAITAHVLNALYAIPSRRIKATEPCIVSVGVVRGGTATNIIPGEVQLDGTIRSFSEEVRRQLWQEVQRAYAVAETLGGEYKLAIVEGYPVLVNDPEMVDVFIEVVDRLLGEGYVEEAAMETGSEDFGVLAQAAKRGGVFSWLGAQIADDPRTHHHPRFDIDEGCLPMGTAILVGYVYRHLE
jgi:amidohydrolase